MKTNCEETKLVVVDGTFLFLTFCPRDVHCFRVLARMLPKRMSEFFTDIPYMCVQLFSKKCL